MNDPIDLTDATGLLVETEASARSSPRQDIDEDLANQVQNLRVSFDDNQGQRQDGVQDPVNRDPIDLPDAVAGSGREALLAAQLSPANDQQSSELQNIREQQNQVDSRQIMGFASARELAELRPKDGPSAYLDSINPDERTLEMVAESSLDNACRILQLQAVAHRQGGALTELFANRDCAALAAQLSQVNANLNRLDSTVNSTVLPDMQHFRDEMGSIHQVVTELQGKLRDQDKMIAEIQVNRIRSSQRSDAAGPRTSAQRVTPRQRQPQTGLRATYDEYVAKLNVNIEYVRGYLHAGVDDPLLRAQLREWFLKFTAVFFPHAEKNIRERFSDHRTIMFLQENNYHALNVLHQVIQDRLRGQFPEREN